MLAHLRRRWSVSGREGFGIRRFSRSKTPIFHCAGGKETEAKGSHWGDRTLDRTLNRTPDRTRLARPVSSFRVQRMRAPARPVGHGSSASDQVLEELHCTRGRSDTVARPIMIDRTRPVVCGYLLESIGRWHCGVQSV
jgi:hypothetical protein